MAVNTHPDSSYQWGLGIEHEVLLLQDKVSEKKGSYIKDNLSPETVYQSPDTITQSIRSHRSYGTYDYLNYDQSLFLEEARQVLDGKLPDNISDLFKEYIVNADLPANYSDSEVLAEMVNSIPEDGTLHAIVPEFISPLWKNRTIHQNINEMRCKQELYRLLQESISGKKCHYPSIGSIFPLNISGPTETPVYAVDYTGSYHLNLSLPFPQLLIAKERNTYLDHHHDIIYKHMSRILTETCQGLSQYNYLARFQALKKMDWVSQLQHVLSLQYPKEEISRQRWNAAIHKLNWLHNGRFSEFRLQSILRKRHPQPSFLGQIHGYFMRNKIRLMVVWHGKQYTFSNILSDNSKYRHQAALDTFHRYLSEINELPKPREAVNSRKIRLWFKIYWDNDTESSYLDVRLGKHFLPLDKVNELFQSDTEGPLMKTTEGYRLYDWWSHHYLKYNSIFWDMFQEYVLWEYQSHFLDAVRPLNTEHNIRQKYQVSTFHHSHKTWAIAIQWVLPLILSVYSSSDPFSIQDRPKLSELSLRMFVSGYSFINLLNIVDYNLPEGKAVLPGQSSSRLLQASRREFSYFEEEEQKQDSRELDPSEYRVDVQKGFHFGFELRAFDNFNIDQLEPLLELLFLLADQIYEADIHSFPNNPFDNKILNRETLHILDNGWNTAIHPDYLDLLEVNLHLSISRHTRLSNHGHPFAYTVINDIYQTLQEKFLHTETLSESQLRLTSCGHYSRFLINRTINSDFPQSLPNINRRSWETAFYQLAWKPGGNLRRRIHRALHKTHTISGLATVLQQTVGSEYLHKVSDILYALETLGELQDYRGTLN